MYSCLSPLLYIGKNIVNPRAKVSWHWAALLRTCYLGEDPVCGVTWDHAGVPAKWHLIPFNGFSRVQQRYIQTERPRYGDICRKARNRQNHWMLSRLIEICGGWRRRLSGIYTARSTAQYCVAEQAMGHWNWSMMTHWPIWCVTHDPSDMTHDPSHLMLETCRQTHNSEVNHTPYTYER